jgi:hypothetical protein
MKTPKECEKNHQNITTSRIIYKKNKKKTLSRNQKRKKDFVISKPEKKKSKEHVQVDNSVIPRIIQMSNYFLNCTFSATR